MAPTKKAKPKSRTAPSSAAPDKEDIEAKAKQTTSSTANRTGGSAPSLAAIMEEEERKKSNAKVIQQLQEMLARLKGENQEDKEEEGRGDEEEEAQVNQKPDETLASSIWGNFDVGKLRGAGTMLECIAPAKQGEEMVAHIEAADVEKEIELWANTVVARVLGAHPPFAVMNDFFHRIWRRKGIEAIHKLPSGLFLIRFKTKEVKTEILEMKMCFFDGHPVLIRDWDPRTDWSKEEIEEVLIWIQLPNLHPRYWSTNLDMFDKDQTFR